MSWSEFLAPLVTVASVYVAGVRRAWLMIKSTDRKIEELRAQVSLASTS